MCTLRARIQHACDAGHVVAGTVATVAACAGLGRTRAYQLRLAADEITTNTMTHGYGGRDGVVDIEAGVDPDCVWLTVSDDAPAFDPRAHDAGPMPAGEPRIGGYGIFLALSSVDEFAYERVGERNRYTLRMRRDTPPVAVCGEEEGTDGETTGRTAGRP